MKHNRHEIIRVEDIKPLVQNVLRRTFTDEHLKQVGRLNFLLLLKLYLPKPSLLLLVILRCFPFKASLSCCYLVDLLPSMGSLHRLVAVLVPDKKLNCYDFWQFFF